MQSLIIGKFYPFHMGHMRLIAKALEASTPADRVLVMIYEHPGEIIPGDLRREWIVQTFPDEYRAGWLTVEVLRDPLYPDYDDPTIWEGHDRLLDAKLRQLQYAPTTVFSSEEYGIQMAEHFGARHVMVDLERVKVPMSATEARRGEKWEHLTPATQLGLIPRVIVVGAESTGTTTLAQDLSRELNARYVPEYGRTYTEELVAAGTEVDDIVWTPSMLRGIGVRQTASENREAISPPFYPDNRLPLIVGDTDAFATAIWEYRYVGTPLADALKLPYAVNLPRRDLYILTDHHGVEFEQDGIRDGEHLRADMTGWFEDSLTSTGKTWALVTGDRENRLRVALNLVKPLLLAERFQHGGPAWH